MKSGERKRRWGHIRDTIAKPGIEAISDGEVEMGRKPGGLDENRFRLIRNLKLET